VADVEQNADITGLVLAGGRGSRMGGVDKGLQLFHGTPLALHTLQRLQSQVGICLINANRNLPTYESYGVPVWPDALADYPGPLAGFLTGLEHCATPYLMTVPCDTPRSPRSRQTLPWPRHLKKMASCANNRCFACSGRA